MLDLMSGFVVELRNAGLPVSLTENLDAMEAVKHIPIEDRDAFKYALAATLVKNEQHWNCLLYTSPSPRDYAASRMPSSA